MAVGLRMIGELFRMLILYKTVGRTYEKIFPFSIAFERTVSIFSCVNGVSVFWTILFAVTTTIAQVPMSLLNEFRERKGVLEKSEIIKSSSGEKTITHDFKLVNSKGDTVFGRIRLPRAAQGTYPVAFLVVGVETGKDVVDMIEGYDNAIVVGIDYPFAGRFDFTGWNAIRTTFSLRETGFTMVPDILLCLDWLFAHPLVDTSDVTLVAVSFGVFTGIPAAVADERVKRLAVVQGGGDLATIIAASSERLNVTMPFWLAGLLGSWILAPFEPNRYVGSFAPRRLLIVSGGSDVFFPRSSVKSLYDHAREPKEWIEHDIGHVMPNEREGILQLARIVVQRLYGSL